MKNKEKIQLTNKDKTILAVCSTLLIIVTVMLSIMWTNNDGVVERMNECLHEGHNMTYCNNNVK